MAAAGYAFDNDSDQATAHHEALANLLDKHTTDFLANLMDLWGARCLDVGAGAGSVAHWLADEVGPSGSVTAVDLKPCLIAERAQLRVWQRDVTCEPLDGSYDLAHARLLLNHLPTRRDVLHRLASHLAPGGLLVTSDFWPVSPQEFVVKASPDDAALLRRYHQAHMKVLTARGNDRGWARAAYCAYLGEGLVDVQTVVHGSYWRGGGAGCRLLLAGLGQLSGVLEAMGLSATEQEQVRVLLTDPATVVHGHLLYTTSGRRPAT